MDDQRIQIVENRLAALKRTASSLNQTIIHSDTKDFLLHSAAKSLHDVEYFLLPQAMKATPATVSMWLDTAEFQLSSANETLIHTQDLVLRYGPGLRVVG